MSIFCFIFEYIIFPAPDVWLEYVQFAIGGIGQTDGIVKAREIFDRALTAVSLHFSKGTVIWDAYREFENAIYAGLQVIKLVYLLYLFD